MFRSMLKSIGNGLRSFWNWLLDVLVRVSAGTWRLVALALLILLILYYPIGMMFFHKIDDDLAYVPDANNAEVGGSLTVSMLAGLIDREVSKNGWVANDPFFKPSALLDNMPNFQQGMFRAFARVSFELTDQIGRTRGSSAVDPDLQEAAGLLQYSGDVWVFNFSTSLLPTASSERQYLKARDTLLNYNRRLAAGDAVFERRADNLLATLDRIALDIGALSAAIDEQIRENSDSLFDFSSDDVFYRIKGQAYAYFMILKALREDFSGIVADRELGTTYDQMLASFEAVVKLDPLIVTNNAPDDQFLPNHLAAQGFYLLRARTQLREITNILLK